MAVIFVLKIQKANREQNKKRKGEKGMRDKLLKASYILAWIGAIWFLLSSESSLWYLVPGALCLTYAVAFGEANNGNWIISPH